MLNPRTSIQRVLRHSGQILKQPNQDNFAYLASRGSDSDALTYVALGSAIVIILNAITFGGTNIIGFLMGIINEVFGFYVFSGIAYYIAQQMGRYANFVDVCYGFALFYVPIRVLYALIDLLYIQFLYNSSFLSFVFNSDMPGLLMGFVFNWPFWLSMVMMGAYAYQAIGGIMRFAKAKDILLCLAASLLLYWLFMRILDSINMFGSF